MSNYRNIKNLTILEKDFTINDFANSSIIRNRQSKKSNMTKEEHVFENWEDCTDEETEPPPENDNINAAKDVIEPICDKVYPKDVWELISEYIVPEDVGRFAGICRATLDITRSTPFWRRIYKRYCRNLSNVPNRLRPEQMKIKCGLRTCVVRSLFYAYPPFTFSSESINFCTPKNLLKRRCLSMWFEKVKNVWIFYFKLKLVNDPIYRKCNTVKAKNIFDILDDITANPEDDCKVLKVYCCDFSNPPPVMGMILNVMNTRVSRDMRSNRLDLGFSANVRSSNQHQEMNLIFNKVAKIKVLDWWHPEYPHCSGILPPSISLNSTKSIDMSEFNCDDFL